MSGAKLLVCAILILLILLPGCVAVEVEYISEGPTSTVPKKGSRLKNPISNPNVLRDGIVPGSTVPGQIGTAEPVCATNGKIVEAIKQDTPYWCWATSAQTIMKFHGKSFDQCKIVTDVKHGGQDFNGSPICCENPGRIDCLQNGWPENALDKFNFSFGTWSYITPNPGIPPSPKQVASQICDNGPFIYIVTYPGGGGHSFTVRKIRQVGNQILVDIFDHRFNNFKEIPYQKFVEGWWDGARYTHDSDIVLIEP